MKAKNFLPLKVAVLFVVIISTSLVIGLGASNYANQMKVFDKSTQNQAESYANIIEVLLRNYKEFDKDNLTEDLTNIIYDVEPIKSISINMISESTDGYGIELEEFVYIESYDSQIKLKDISIYERLNINLIGEAINEIEESGRYPNHTIMSKTKLADGTSWLIITPLSYSSNSQTFILGTIAILMSWEGESETYERELMNLIYGSFIFIIVAVITLVYISRIISKKNR